MPDVDALTAFCRARLDDERAAAEAAMTEIDTPGMYSHGEWSADSDAIHDRTRPYLRDDDLSDSAERYPSWATVATVDRFGYPGERVRAHIARQDPAATLARVEALRALVDLHQPRYSEYVDADGMERGSDDCQTCDNGGVSWTWPCKTARHVAAIRRDHPDYREEWKP